jgi:hypothetical protein
MRSPKLLLLPSDGWGSRLLECTSSWGRHDRPALFAARERGQAPVSSSVALAVEVRGDRHPVRRQVLQDLVRVRQPNAADELRCTLSHARIPIEEVRTFWAQVQELARTFARIPRAGDQVYGFAAGLYPTDAPTPPDPEPGSTG